MWLRSGQEDEEREWPPELHRADFATVLPSPRPAGVTLDLQKLADAYSAPEGGVPGWSTSAPEVPRTVGSLVEPLLSLL